MLKEVCITPHIFNPSSYLELGGWKDINSLFEVLSISGFVVGLNNKDWNKAVATRIDRLSPRIKDKLKSSLKILKDRDRIAGHPKGDTLTGEEESDWFAVGKQLDDIREFYGIIANQSFNEKTITLEQLENINIYEHFGFTGSMQVLKTEENLRKILLPFLSYSKKVVIIDPYFYLDKERCLETLKVAAQCFRERRGAKETGRISIHCKWDGERSEFAVPKWQKAISSISKKFQHSIDLSAWEGLESSVKLHDRYILTNQSGLISAAGTDTDDRQFSEWSIKEYGELNTILSQYRVNSSPFKLKCTVSDSSIDYY